MADSAGGMRFRMNLGDGRGRRLSRPLLYGGLFAVVGLVAWLSPRGLTVLHVGVNAVAGLALAGVAVVARKWPGRIYGLPVWLASLALGACFLALAVLEARQKLG